MDTELSLPKIPIWTAPCSLLITASMSQVVTSTTNNRSRERSIPSGFSEGGSLKLTLSNVAADAKLTRGRRLKLTQSGLGYSQAEGLMLVAERAVEIRVLKLANRTSP